MKTVRGSMKLDPLMTVLSEWLPGAGRLLTVTPGWRAPDVGTDYSVVDRDGGFECWHAAFEICFRDGSATPEAGLPADQGPLDPGVCGAPDAGSGHIVPGCDSDRGHCPVTTGHRVGRPDPENRGFLLYRGP